MRYERLRPDQLQERRDYGCLRPERQLREDLLRCCDTCLVPFLHEQILRSAQDDGAGG